MGMFVKLAWRNILRNRRRSMVTIAAISLGLGILIHLNGFNDGFKEQMTENSVRLYIMGHVLIHQAGFQEEMAVEKYISNTNEILKAIKKGQLSSHIQAIAKRVKFQALISSTTGSYGVMAVGISPRDEERITSIKKTIISGGFFGGFSC